MKGVERIFRQNFARSLRVGAAIGGRRPLLLQSRCLADDAPARFIVEPELHEEREKYSVESPYDALPFINRDDLDPEPMPEVVAKDAVRYTNSMPESVQETLNVRIYKPARNIMQNTREDTIEWALDVDNQEKWNNQCMGYASSADPVGATGIRNLRFTRLEDAKTFCEKNGYKFQVDTPNPITEHYGDKIYAANFLSFHVRNRRAKMTPKQLIKSQYAHPESGKTCWVNLKHTPHGGEASKVVSGTQWSDPHPANHGAKDWHAKGLGKEQELARKLGK